MSTPIQLQRLLIVLVAPALLAAVVPFALAQTNGAAQRFTAIAVNLSNVGRTDMRSGLQDAGLTVITKSRAGFRSPLFT